MTETPFKDIFSAALIIIGNEILSGRTQDSNTPWIAERMTERGIVLGEVRIISDEEEQIIHAVNELRRRYDYVFTTGGIGPTHDDITAASVAKAFGLPLVRNDVAHNMLEQHYGAEELTPPRAKMALIPQGATLIPNPVTAAPGFIIGNVHVMAGVPRIMQVMMEHIMSGIKAGQPILSNSISCTLPESAVAEGLGELAIRYPDVQIGSYPHYRGGILGLSLVMRSTKPDLLERATEDLIMLIREKGDEPRTLSIKARDRVVG